MSQKLDWNTFTNNLRDFFIVIFDPEIDGREISSKDKEKLSEMRVAVFEKNFTRDSLANLLAFQISLSRLSIKSFIPDIRDLKVKYLATYGVVLIYFFAKIFDYKAQKLIETNKKTQVLFPVIDVIGFKFFRDTKYEIDEKTDTSKYHVWNISLLTEYNIWLTILIRISKKAEKIIGDFIRKFKKFTKDY
jgi:hypothetical protein